MKTYLRTNRWIAIGVLVFILMSSCQFGSLSLTNLTSSGKETSQAAQINSTLTANVETEAAKASPTPPPPTNTVIPSYTSTQLPSPTSPPTRTARPTATKIQTTATPELSIVIVVNNLNVVIFLTLNGPINKIFSVQAHSTYTFQAPPGNYHYSFKAKNFYPQNDFIYISPIMHTWTFGKVK